MFRLESRIYTGREKWESEKWEINAIFVAVSIVAAKSFSQGNEIEFVSSHRR